MKKISGNKLFGIIIGALLILCGVVYALNVFGIATINFSLDGWWALFIIIPSLSGLISSKDKLSSLIGLGIGVLLLLGARSVIEYDTVWKIIVPVIIAALGVKLIIKTLKTKDTETDGEQKEMMAAFSEQSADYNGEEVAVAKVGAVFGGAKCNLRNTKIVDGCHVDVMSIFGGVDILVPENVTVKNNLFSLFGGIDDKRTTTNAGDNNTTLYINGFCVFGGVDIK